MEFAQAFERLQLHEGGWNRDPQDSGNWTGGTIGVGELRGTKLGISAAQYPALDIEHLTVEQARGIYRRDYWAECQCDNLPAWCRCALFDGAVNSGVRPASKWLQAAVGTRPDGIIGAKTIGAKTIAATRASDAWRTLALFGAYRLLYMTDARGWHHHGRGWARRIASNIIEAEA